MKHSFSLALTALALAAALTGPALAADAALPWDQVYCFSAADFQTEDGVLLTSVPQARLGRLMLGSRQLRAGDAVTGEQLSHLTFEPAGDLSGDAVITCLRRTETGTGGVEMTLKVRKNQPPTAEDSEFETYKNIPGQVPLTVSDPEGEPLTVTIVKAPKRGDLALAEDGTVTYTPRENKVGKDSFIYTVTDPAGNVSQEATVRIEIRKPADKAAYSDMTGDPALLAATWLREEGIYSGETLGQDLLFCPEKPVSRGEFIAMCASFLGRDRDAELLDSGFSDETPAWLSPYVSTALRCGYLRGIPTADGLTLQAGSAITQAQAASMVSDMLGLDTDATPVMARNDSVPAWAAGAVHAMETVYPLEDPGAALTRREAAMLLYAAGRYSAAHQDAPSLLSWAAR